MYFLICYDISSPQRLRRVARLLEKHAIRCQKSVFLFQGSQISLGRLLRLLSKEINHNVDIIQAWKLARDERVSGTALGDCICIDPGAVILGQEKSKIIPPYNDWHRRKP